MDKDIVTRLRCCSPYSEDGTINSNMRLIEEAANEIIRLREQLRVARLLLWTRHGCPITALYGDDGEMQCRNCGIDFKRTEPGEIDRMFKQAGLARIDIDAMKEKPNA